MARVVFVVCFRHCAPFGWEWIQSKVQMANKTREVVFITVFIVISVHYINFSSLKENNAFIYDKNALINNIIADNA